LVLKNFDIQCNGDVGLTVRCDETLEKAAQPGMTVAQESWVNDFS